MDLHTPVSSSDEEIYRIADAAQRTSTSAKPASGNNRMDDDVTAVSVAVSSEPVPRTLVADPVIVAPGDASGVVSASTLRPATDQSGRDASNTAVNFLSEASRSPALAGSQPIPEPTKASQGDIYTSGAKNEVQRKTLSTRRRKRVRLRYVVQAWGVSLVVHVVILSALAAATFSSRDTLKKALSFDSALASFRNGEPEVLPIYADPDNVPRDRAIGDEYAATPGNTAPVVLTEGGSDNEGEESGGMIAESGVGAGRLSNTPKIRGVGKGRINEGSSLPGVKIDGLGSSPLALLPADTRRRLEWRRKNRRRSDL